MDDGGAIGDATGHLFDDSKFGSIYTALDIEEIARTKKANLREELAFQHHAQLLQQQQRTLARSHNHEITEIRQKLKDIQAKTPNFIPHSRDKTLAHEKHNRLLKRMRLSNTPSLVRNETSKAQNPNGYGNYLQESVQDLTQGSGNKAMEFQSKQNVRFMQSSSSLNNLEKNVLIKSPDDSKSTRNTSRSVSLPNLAEYPTDTTTEHQQKRTLPAPSSVVLPRLAPLPKDSKPQRSRLEHRKPLSFQKDIIKPSTRGYIRRASYLAKSLGELYSKRQSVEQERLQQSVLQQTRPPQNNMFLYASYLH